MSEPNNVKVEKPKAQEADFEALVEAHMITWKSTKVEAIKAVSMKFPEAHQQYLARHNPHNRTLQEGL